MKNIKLLIGIISIITFLASCMELDQVNPNSPTVESFWKTEEDLYKGLMGTYARLQDDYYGGGRINGVALNLSDIGTTARPSGEYYQVARFRIEPSEFYWWGPSYQIISRAYQVIDRAEGIGDNGHIRVMVGEAKFLVALAYYNLIQMFGHNIAYVDHEMSPDEFAPRANNTTIYDLIEGLLQEAIPDLPYQYSTDQYGRVTKGAAQSLLGKIYMQFHEYQKASEQFTEVIASQEYELLENFGDNFTRHGDINIESIFQVNFRLNGPNTDTDENGIYHSYGLVEKDELFADYHPTPFVLESFRKELDKDGNPDPRLNETLFHENHPGTYYGMTYDDWRYLGTLDLLQTGSWDTIYNSTFMKYSEQEGFEASGRESDNLVFDGHYKIGQTDFIVIRYADILLLQAEALNAISGPGTVDDLGNSAYDYVDMVRERSNMHPLSTVKPNLSQSEFLQQLQHERVVELTEECVRYFDLRRWGLYNNSNPNDSDFETWTSEDQWANIPLNEREVNPNLESNPGY